MHEIKKDKLGRLQCSCGKFLSGGIVVYRDEEPLTAHLLLNNPYKVSIKYEDTRKDINGDI